MLGTLASARTCPNIGLRLGCVWGRLLATGSYVLRETIRKGRPRPALRVSLV